MYKGMIILAAVMLAAASLTAVMAQDGQVYKVVDENGNVIFTDTPPEDGSAPMDLPELTVIQTNFPKAGETKSQLEGAAESEQGNSLRDLRRLYRDFSIYSPGQEETIVGTGNQVMIRWGSQTPFEPGLTAVLSVNGENTDVAPQGSVTVRLDRGEHNVQAILKDPRGRTIASAGPVKFFVRQNSANFRPRN